MGVYVRENIPLKTTLGFTESGLGIPKRVRDKLHIFIGKDTFGLVYVAKIHTYDSLASSPMPRWTFILTEDNTLRGEDVARICLELP